MRKRVANTTQAKAMKRMSATLTLLAALIAAPAAADEDVYQYFAFDLMDFDVHRQGEFQIDDISVGGIRFGVGSGWLGLETRIAFGLESEPIPGGQNRLDVSSLYGLYLVPGLPLGEWLEVKFPLGFTWLDISEEGPGTFRFETNTAWSWGARLMVAYYPFALGLEWMRWADERDEEIESVGLSVELRL